MNIFRKHKYRNAIRKIYSNLLVQQSSTLRLELSDSDINTKKVDDDKLDKGSLKHNKCGILKQCFDDEFIIDGTNNKWNLHIKGEKKQLLVELINFTTAHDMLGCRLIQKLYLKSPRCLFVPMVTLLSCYPNHVSSKLNFECLYRNEDEAVGLDFGSYQLYLTPTNVNSSINHLLGFEIVTQKKPSIDE